jgi:hypothetical protein
MDEEREKKKKEERILREYQRPKCIAGTSNLKNETYPTLPGLGLQIATAGWARHLILPTE